MDRGGADLGRGLDPLDDQYLGLHRRDVDRRLGVCRMSLPPRFDVDTDEIIRVVRSFYSAVRDDPVLGPVFGGHVADWPSHEDKIVLFWRNAILGERCYSGNPMQVHLKAKSVDPDHFAGWLTLFDEVLQRELPQTSAQAWSALAHRIGQGLRSGLLAQRGGFGALPDLG
jgi:hemoglobin